MNKLVMLILLTAVASTAKRLSKDKVIYAVNCGSAKPVKSVDGYLYQAVL